MIFDPFVEMLSQVLRSGLIYDYFIPLFCVAFVATVPFIIRSVFRG